MRLPHRPIQIASIKYGSLPRAQLLPSNQKQLLATLESEGIPIPALKRRKLRRGDYHVFLADSSVEVQLTDGTILCWDISRGWICDLASVPRAFRWLVDNDDGCMLIAAIVHDSCFESQRWGRSWSAFSVTNEIFRAMIEHQGGTRVQVSAAWAAVQTAGWIVWLGVNDADRRYGRRMVGYCEGFGRRQGNSAREDEIERARRLAGGRP